MNSWTLEQYCTCAQCYGRIGTITPSGHILGSDDHLKVCAAPEIFPYGTIITVSGGWNGILEVFDRGGSVNEKKINIYCKSHQDDDNLGKIKYCNISH